MPPETTLLSGNDQLEGFVKDRVAILLRHFSEIDDKRDPLRILYPLSEVLLLLVCATIASCDDFDDIVEWGEAHLDFLRRFAPFARGVPCARWVRTLVNRIPPALFAQCFNSWIKALWPGRHDLIAIDGKTSRRTHDPRKGVKALHTLSAYATNARLVLAQLSVPEKTNEITAIPDLLDDLASQGHLKGAMVTTDAMGCQVDIAAKIIEHGADFMLAVKGNQRTLERDLEDYFRDAPSEELVTKTAVDKNHGRIETRFYTASAHVHWLTASRSYPGMPRFEGIRTIIKNVNRVEYRDKCTFDTRFFISSAPLDIERFARCGQGHWGVESMHWLLDTEFKDDHSRYRSGFGAKNMAVARRFALNLVRAEGSKKSVKTRRKSASWDTDFLLKILQLTLP